MPPKNRNRAQIPLCSQLVAPGQARWYKRDCFALPRLPSGGQVAMTGPELVEELLCIDCHREVPSAPKGFMHGEKDFRNHLASVKETFDCSLPGVV